MMSVEEKEALIKSMVATFTNDVSVAKSGMVMNSKIRFAMTTICKTEPQLIANLPCPTAGANGKAIFIDPEFWQGLNVKQRMRVLFHEGFHNMFGHCDKRIHSDTDRQAWNIAADCVVEAFGTLCDVGEGKYMEGTINPNQYGNVTLKINGKQLVIDECHNKSVEEIYALIMKHVEKNPSKGGAIDWRTGDGHIIHPMDSHELGEASNDERNEREETLRQALVEHKLKGTMPGPLADMIENMLKGKINWKAELRDMIMPETKSYLSCKKRNRRGAAFDVILPGMVKEGIEVTISIDTSGSIGKKEIEYYMGEITNLFKQFDENTVHATIMMHHSEVYDQFDVATIRDLTQLKTRSGGTSHVDVFNKAEEINTKVLICLTDGYSDFPESTKIAKILWIVTNEGGMSQIPDNLGKKIHVPLEDFADE